MMKKHEFRRPILKISPKKIIYCSLLVTLSIILLLPSIVIFESRTDDISSNVYSIYDPYILRKNPPLHFDTSVCEREPGTGEEGPAGIRGLYKIKKALSKDVPKIRLLCMVYSHSERHDIVRSIAETYGRSCDGFWVASNLTDANIGASMLSHTGEESYDNMYIKIRGM
jgi:hypothetical protein